MYSSKPRSSKAFKRTTHENRDKTATVVQRLDYTAPAFWIETVELTFDLDPAKTRVLQQDAGAPQPRGARAAPAPGWRRLNLARVLVNGSGT